MTFLPNPNSKLNYQYRHTSAKHAIGKKYTMAMYSSLSMIIIQIQKGKLPTQKGKHMLARLTHTPFIRSRLDFDPLDVLDSFFNDVMIGWNTWHEPNTYQLTPNYRSECIDGKLQYELDLPGVTDSDVEITIEDKALLITGTRGKKEFKYRLAPGNKYDIESTTGSLAHGVLTLTVQPQRKTAPKKIPLLKTKE